MYIVTLTGGIGSGKTTVANRFAALGIRIVDADLIARQVVEPGSPALTRIREHFGSHILDPRGALDRRALRERIFAHPAEKAWLNALLHPLISEEMVRQCQQADSPYCLLVVPLLVENHLTGLGQRVLVIDVDEEVQVERTCRRDRVTPEQAQAIIASQATRNERLAVADDVIVNQDRSEAELESEILGLHQQYLTFATQQGHTQ
ncbi:dephospho-CoA kinase [Aeromonas schubertii]|uniref:dephospho-CoA kinase n=1 Tax=Aeromonas schubertii TaxID=652 RepID=UPI0010A878DB|nr:dephospho-CoA kinase [Aeromonas schubertii]MBZ6072296.1 dephospho-CoA kinase [Aeromonas schubertii]QCG49201.1 dephospho-CoA kinase [Aeromonas schubertii]